MKKEALRVSTTIPSAPTTVYLAWIDSAQHSAMTGCAAKFDPNVGSKFSTLDGYISGKLVILDLGRRIVMSWRTTDFPKEVTDSRVEIHFEALGGSTRITILHTDIPEGQGERYRSTWNDRYFLPMRTHFSKYLPDPRKPPPPRRPPPPEEESAPKGKLGKGKGPQLAKSSPSLPTAAPSGKKLPKPVPSKPAPKAVPSKPAPKAIPSKPAPKAVPSKPAPKAVPSKPAPKAVPSKPAKPVKPAPKKAPAKPTPKKPAPKKPAPKKAPAKPTPKKPAPKKKR